MCGNQIRTILLTGGIGSGKSAVAGILRSKGIPVYDCDASAKNVYERNPGVVARLESLLGVSLRNSDGSFCRKALADIIFKNSASLSAVESFVHPAVLEDFMRWRSSQNAPVVAIESAIAKEKPLFQGLWDAVVVVTAPLEQRLERVMARDGMKSEDVIARIKAQNTSVLGADAVINNDCGMAALEERTSLALKILNIQ